MLTKTLPLGTEVELKGMTGRDEDLLTNKKKVQDGSAIDELMANCTVRLGETTKVQVGDINRLEEPDRSSLLLAIRRESYGDEMDAELTCSECKKKWNVQVDLSTIEDKNAPDDYVAGEPFDGTLSNGTKVRFRYLTGVTEKKVSKAGEARVTEAMLARLEEVQNVHKNDLRKWLLGLEVKIRAELRALMASKDCGPDFVKKADCPNCETENEFSVQAQASFFFPEQ